MTQSTEQLLEDRKKTHGEFRHHAAATQHLKDYFKKFENWNTLSDCQKESLEMIAHKIGRILTGNPNLADHWDDIAGYAKLIPSRIDFPTGFVQMNRQVPREVEDNALHGIAQEKFKK